VSFSVPTGNFGDIFAGYLAKQMGLPIDQLIVATNANDILHRCISANDHSKKELQHSLSPSMDIMVSSNFERLLFDASRREGAVIRQLMDDFTSGSMTLSDSAMEFIGTHFDSYRLDDEKMVQVIADVFDNTEYLLDPHTAIGVEAARKVRRDASTPVVCLATAHPAKFAEAIQKAGLQDPALPHHMADLFDREERCQVLENDKSKVHAFMQDNIRI
jgi:threonine synthase